VLIVAVRFRARVLAAWKPSRVVQGSFRAFRLTGSGSREATKPAPCPQCASAGRGTACEFLAPSTTPRDERTETQADRTDRTHQGEVIELDVGEATLTDVAFPGSAVRRMRLDYAALNNVDFRGAIELDLASGRDCLRGAVIDSTQLVELAPGLAQALGIVVRDR
jgi:hypothetical protein